MLLLKFDERGKKSLLEGARRKLIEILLFFSVLQQE